MVVYDEKFVKKLQHDLVMAKWANIPQQERDGALRAFMILAGVGHFSKKEFEFITQYVERRDAADSLPFD